MLKPSNPLGSYRVPPSNPIRLRFPIPLLPIPAAVIALAPTPPPAPLNSLLLLDDGEELARDLELEASGGRWSRSSR